MMMMMMMVMMMVMNYNSFVGSSSIINTLNAPSQNESLLNSRIAHCNSPAEERNSLSINGCGFGRHDWQSVLFQYNIIYHWLSHLFPHEMPQYPHMTFLNV